MCTVSINVNESLIRRYNPSLTNHEAITQWVQHLVDSTLRRTASPIAYSTDEARQLVTDRLDRLERGMAETTSHDEVKQRMESLLS